ncbi:MAG: AgmX/PglI C-terminal domain-containing protein [Myxococcota bacterium]
MKFSCPKCSARYSILDDRIPTNKTLRFTCKKCKNVIRLRRKVSEHQGAPSEPDITSAPPQPSTESTRVASFTEIQGVKKRSRDTSPAPPPPDDAQTPEWFVLVKGEQKGPMAAVQVDSMLERGEIDLRTYTWREGMDDWVRLGTLPRHAGTSAPPPSPPMPPEPTPISRTDNPPIEMESTRAMNVSELREQLARVRDGTAQDDDSMQDMADMDTSILDAAPFDLTKLKQEARMPSRDGSKGAAKEDQPTRQMEAPTPEELAKAFSGSFAASSPPGEFPLEDTPTVSPGSLASFPVDNPAYLQGPPGEATRVFMATAGIYKRRRMHRVFAVVASIALTLLVSIISLDIAGVIEIPGMGLVYDVTGFEDPNIERAVTRTENELRSGGLSDVKRRELQSRLLGLTQQTPRRRNKDASKSQSTQGIEQKETLTLDQRTVARGIFDDVRKTEKNVNLTPPSEIQTPNLPAGLTQESIMKVVSESSRSVSLCITQSMKAGENLSGKMEVELTIVATGDVSDAAIATSKFRSSVMGTCTVKTVKRWKFPKFNGEPVTVVFPYVLSAGF